MEPFAWKCPFCSRDATISDHDFHQSYTDLTLKNADGERRVLTEFIVCPNPECKKLSLSICICTRKFRAGFGWSVDKVLRKWTLIPASKASSIPEYVPKAVRDDYNEACLIVDLSPKASATLARRCLQGILRDFWEVRPAKLSEEINEVKDRMDPLTWEAIDSVRKIGNIGAHMEKDIDLIIDVEPVEAELLIGLIETLIKDWYVAREERKKRLEQVKSVAAAKEEAKSRNKKT